MQLRPRWLAHGSPYLFWAQSTELFQTVSSVPASSRFATTLVALSSSWMTAGLELGQALAMSFVAYKGITSARKRLNLFLRVKDGTVGDVCK